MTSPFGITLSVKLETKVFQTIREEQVVWPEKRVQPLFYGLRIEELQCEACRKMVPWQEHDGYFCDSCNRAIDEHCGECQHDGDEYEYYR